MTNSTLRRSGWTRDNSRMDGWTRDDSRIFLVTQMDLFRFNEEMCDTFPNCFHLIKKDKRPRGLNADAFFNIKFAIIVIGLCGTIEALKRN